MASIKMTADDFNAIVKACKPFVAKKPIQPATASIHLSCDGHTVTALALDGVKALKMTVGAVEPSDRCEISMPPLKPVKAKETPFVEVCGGGSKTITVVTSTGTQIVPIDYCDPGIAKSVSERAYANTESVKSVFFNPQELAAAFAAIPTECVRIDYYGEVKPIEFHAMSDREAYHGIVLPMRCSDTRLKEAK